MKTLLMLALMVVPLWSTPSAKPDSMDAAEYFRRLRIEYDEKKIVVMGGGYQQDLEQFEKKVGNLKLLIDKVRDCDSAVQILKEASRLKKKRLKYVFGQWTFLCFPRKYEMVGWSFLAISGFSFVMKIVYSTKIENRMDEAVEVYNEWLLIKLGLKGQTNSDNAP
jgi:hypothetical protein